MKRNILIEIICFLFIVLFLYAAGTKLLEYKAFVGQIGKSPLLTTYARWLAWLVPVVEIIIALLLMIPSYRTIGLYAAFGIMTLFTFYISAILMLSTTLPCACGGVLSMLGWRAHLVFNLAFVALGILGICLNTSRKLTTAQQ